MIISGPSGVGKDTIIDALRAPAARPRLPLRRHLHDPRAAARRGRRRELPLHGRERRSCALRDAGGSSRRTRSTATGTARRGRRSSGRSPAGHDVILKIDVQGAQQVKERVADALLIFVVPPSMETLFARLKSRATETADELELRQRNAAIELARQDDYDYVVTNETGQVERTAARIDEIIAEVHALHPARRGPRLTARRGVTLGLDAAGPGRPRPTSAPVRAASRSRSTRPARAVARPTRIASRPTLADLVPGEAVLVEFGRRQALGVILAEADAAPGGRRRSPSSTGPRRRSAAAAARPRRSRARSPTTTSRRRRSSSGRCCRRACSSGSSWSPNSRPGVPARRTAPRPGRTRDLVDAARAPARGRSAIWPARRSGGSAAPPPARWPRPAGSSSTGRSVGAGGGPRYERWVRLHEAGRAAAARLRGGRPAPGRPLGPRQVERAGGAGRRARRRHGRGGPGRRATGPATVAGLVRRGLVEAEVRERPRRPLAGRPPGLRGGRPPDERPRPAQAEARRARSGGDGRPRPDAAPPRRRDRRRQDRGLRRGDRRQPRRRPAGARSWSPRSRWPCRSSTGSGRTSTSRVALVHSGLGDGERADEWRRIRAGDVDIVVGTRLAVLAPLADVGVVIVDEEHDAGVQERSDAPAPGPRRRDPPRRRWPARRSSSDRRRRRSRRVGRARSGRYGASCCRPARRAARPTVEIVDLRAGARRGRARAAVARARRPRSARSTPTAGEQAILVLNRRGTASVVLCRDCGHVQACPDCERPLVYHQAGTTLRCHHCGRATPLATRCPACGSPRIRYLGGGTERVEREVRDRFPGLRVGRLDRDVVERRARRSASSMPSRRAGSTSSSGRASWPRASTSRA